MIAKYFKGSYAVFLGNLIDNGDDIGVFVIICSLFYVSCRKHSVRIYQVLIEINPFKCSIIYKSVIYLSVFFDQTTSFYIVCDILRISPIINQKHSIFTYSPQSSLVLSLHSHLIINIPEFSLVAGLMAQDEM